METNPTNDPPDIVTNAFSVDVEGFDIPSLIKKVAQNGLEISCHNYSHIRVFDIKKMSTDTIYSRRVVRAV